MADYWGSLGTQVVPTGGALTDIYTVPAGKNVTFEVVMCNLGGATTVRLSYAVAGAGNANPQYLLYDFALAANDAISTTRITGAAGAVIRAQSAVGSTVAFNVNGIEQDV